MKCPFCDKLEDKVIDSRTAREGEVIRRRRECLGCKRRFTTYERIEENLPMVVKKDNRREPYDRAKILNGLKKACEKRPVSIGALGAATDRIEKTHSRPWGNRSAQSSSWRRGHASLAGVGSSGVCAVCLGLS